MCRECSWKNSAPVIFQWYQINRSRFPPSGLHSSRFKRLCSCFFFPVLGFLTWLVESVGLAAWPWLSFEEQSCLKQTLKKKSRWPGIYCYLHSLQSHIYVCKSIRMHTSTGYINILYTFICSICKYGTSMKKHFFADWDQVRLFLEGLTPVPAELSQLFISNCFQLSRHRRLSPGTCTTSLLPLEEADSSFYCSRNIVHRVQWNTWILFFFSKKHGRGILHVTLFHYFNFNKKVKK